MGRIVGLLLGIHLFALVACHSEPYYFQLFPYPERFRPEQSGWLKMASVTIYESGDINRRVVVKVVNADDKLLATVTKEYVVGDVRADVRWVSPNRATVTIYKGSPVSMPVAASQVSEENDLFFDRFDVPIR